jgi:hypothetical protein
VIFGRVRDLLGEEIPLEPLDDCTRSEELRLEQIEMQVNDVDDSHARPRAARGIEARSIPHFVSNGRFISRFVSQNLTICVATCALFLCCQGLISRVMCQPTASHSLSHFTSASGFWMLVYSSIATIELRPPPDDVGRQKGCKVRIARHPPRTQKSGKSCVPTVR